jgi:hypothetical protein
MIIIYVDFFAVFTTYQIEARFNIVSTKVTDIAGPLSRVK